MNDYKERFDKWQRDAKEKFKHLVKLSIGAQTGTGIGAQWGTRV